MGAIKRDTRSLDYGPHGEFPKSGFRVLEFRV